MEVLKQVREFVPVTLEEVSTYLQMAEELWEIHDEAGAPLRQAARANKQLPARDADKCIRRLDAVSSVVIEVLRGLNELVQATIKAEWGRP